MQVLIVHAHPEPRSFNGAMTGVAQQTLTEQGHQVTVSDLYAMNFHAASDRTNFATVADDGYFKPQAEETHASEHGGFASDLEAEIRKLEACDLLIFQFPIWWFGLPAILKGWIDRVFVSGGVYGRSAVFERGRLRGKRAIACVTTGAPEAAFGRDGLFGDLDTLLRPLHRGVLGFTGMTVLPPYAAWHVPYVGAAERGTMIDAWREHLGALDTLVPLPMPTLADHPESGFGDGPRPGAG